MTETSFSLSKQVVHRFLDARWLVILAGLAIQVLALSTVLSHLDAPSSPDITLAQVAGSPGVCQVLALRPFSEPWMTGAQPGLQVRLVGAPANNPCALTTQKIQMSIVGLPVPGQHYEVAIQPQPVDFLDLALVFFLAIIFNVTGIAIFLRSQNRPLARVAYALFTCTGLVLCMVNLRGANYALLNLLGFTVATMVRALSVTLVCLFAYPLARDREKRRRSIKPYLPLLVGAGLALFSAFLPIAPMTLRLAFIAVNGIANVAAGLIVLGVITWGLRKLSRQERQFVRMVAIGLMFLLIPLILNLGFIHTDTVTQTSLIRMIPIPLAILPIACDYALFRQNLLGTTSMLSRKAMRGLLWLLLANVFLFPSIILLRTMYGMHARAEFDPSGSIEA